jgi:hypothetical protein
MFKCQKCGINLDSSHYNYYKQVCDECVELAKKQSSEFKEQNIQVEKHKKICKTCGLAKEIGKEIYHGIAINCFKCLEEIRQKEKDRLASEKNKYRTYPCKDCGELFEVDRHKTRFRCEACAEKAKNKPKTNNRKCKICNLEYNKKENFNFKVFVCDNCAKKQKELEEYLSKHKKCQSCDEFKIINTEISKKGKYCFECHYKLSQKRKNLLKKTSWERKCPDCDSVTVTENPNKKIIFCDKCRKKENK